MTCSKCLAILAAMLLMPLSARAWLEGPFDMKGEVAGIAEAWKLDPAMAKSHYGENDVLRVAMIDSSVPATLLHPGESIALTVQVVNKSKAAIAAGAKVEIIRYQLQTPGSDVFKQTMVALDSTPGEAVKLDLPAGKFQNVTLKPAISQTFGGYAVILDVGEKGRFFVGSVTRTMQPDPRPVQMSQFSLDQNDPTYLERMGIKAIRLGVGYKPTTDGDFDKWYAATSAKLRAYGEHHITVLLTVWWGAQSGPTQPLGRSRPKLADDGRMMNKAAKPDVVWQPSYDPDFQNWCTKFATDFGWPNGPVTGFALWNEPWEGGSIDYWGADVLRFREIYSAMARGVVAAREQAKVNVLLCGCDSTSNTWDKLFSDGSDTFLPWLDVVTIHYQGMAVPSLYKKWNDRPQGRVLRWDTESWLANSDDRIATCAAGTFSAGIDRQLGVVHTRVIQEEDVKVLTEKGTTKARVAQTFSVAAAEKAADTLIGERRFKQLLFSRGLPFVMEFNGGPTPDFYKPDDGTLVVVGDMGPTFGRNTQVYRTVQTLANRKAGTEIAAKLAALPADSADRLGLQRQLEALRIRTGATMRFDDNGGKFLLLDFYGNRVPAENGTITVPLDSRGFFLRTDGSTGSFEALIAAVKAARIDGIEPVELKAHDMLARIDQKPSVVVTINNVLNRPVTGTLSATLGDLSLVLPAEPITLAPNEVRDIPLQITGGKESPENAYPLHVTFDGGPDGAVPLDEVMHCNVIAKRTITVDGKLDDWQGVLPQTIFDTGGGPSVAEAAWFTTVQKFDAASSGGSAQGYLAYDDQNFYFAAKVADSTPDDGMRRQATLNDDDFFYPADFYDVDKDGKKIPMHWPDGVRRYSYRTRYDLPCGNAPGHDNVQIAFNAIEAGDDDTLAYPPGTMPQYVAYKCTDHEFALNKVADQFGGGTEIWKLTYPGMPEKQFFPRQPKSPMDGPVEGKLVITQDGTTRITEVAIPWTAMPLVKKHLDDGRPIKFSFRVNDNKSSGLLELASGRSVSKINPLAFQAHWKEHWANEVEFAFEK